MTDSDVVRDPVSGRPLHEFVVDPLAAPTVLPTEGDQELAITDGLTSLYNSRHFFNQLKTEIERYSRYRHPLSLLISKKYHNKIIKMKLIRTGRF